MEGNKKAGLLRTLQKSPGRVKASVLVMGLGQLLQGQIGKGILYIAILAGFIWYLAMGGISDIAGFFTLGTVEGDAWLGIKGDDSVMMLLRGILAFIIILLFASIYMMNLRDVLASEEKLRRQENCRAFSGRWWLLRTKSSMWWRWRFRCSGSQYLTCCRSSL